MDTQPPATACEPPKDAVALLLAAGKSVTAAAAAAGLHRSTIHGWLRNDPGFAAAVESARRDFAETLRDKLRDAAVLALDTLTDLLTRPDTPPSVRLRTALAILERPQFPRQGWNLPEPVEPAAQAKLLEQLARIDADYQLMRQSRALRQSLEDMQAAAGIDTFRHKNETSPARGPLPDLLPTGDRRIDPALFAAIPASSKTHPPQPPRNAPCPCGSGKKFKRCCGQSAPPVLGALKAA